MDLPTQKASLVHNLRKLALKTQGLALVWAPLLIAILALALRLYGINWDQEHLFHPDERAILFHVYDMRWPSPSDWTVVFDAEKSPLNPQWFPYGSLPLYTAKVVQAALSPIRDLEFHDLRFVGRSLSALSDVGTVIFVFLLASRLYSRRVGILASLLAALAVVHIQLSHFYAVDTYLTFFIVVSVYFMARVMQGGRLRDSLLAGAFIGLALASKISVAPIFLAFVVAHIVYAYSQRGKGLALARPSGSRLALTARNLALGGAASLVILFITTPYAFLDWSRPNPCEVPFSFLGFLDSNYFACDVGAQYNMARGTSGLPFTQQYIGTTAYWYHIEQLAIFGLGLPLGIVAWASLVFTAVLAIGRRSKGDLLILAWVLPYFLLTGYLQVKFLRYMLPITPFLVVLGARMLFWIRDWVAEHRPHQITAVHWSMGFVVVATGFYALSYMSIYSQPHTAVRASQWISENVPRGSILLREHWEEELPSLTGYRLGCGNQWDTQSCMKMYDSDYVRYEGGKDKMTRVAEQLAGADYLVFFSNRLYGSIPRVPERYPQSGDYYRKLFGGELGYRLEHWEATYPELLGIAFVDDTFSRPDLPTPAALGPYRPAPLAISMGYADESFSVYDHPKVLIFKNQARLSAAEIRARLLQPLDDADGEKTLLLTDADLAAQREGGTWTAIFDPDSLVNRFPAAMWLLWIEGLAILTLPLSLFIFRVLPDRGYLLTKPLGLLLTAYVAWLMASLHWMPFSLSSVMVAALLVASASLLVVYSRRVDLSAFFRENLRLVVVGEAIFLMSFLAFLLLRAANPDLWHPYNGGEKPMEMAYLTAVVRSTYMPPYDPWFAGGYINYYYFGQFIVASLVKVTGILPEIAFNLAVPLFFALTTTAVFSLVYNLAEGTRRSHTGVRRLPSPVLAGLAAVFFVAIMGNLDGIVQVGQGLARVWFHDQPFGTFDFWRSSRAIPRGDPPGHEITEFPFFTFLFADLHAHMMAIPFTLLSLGLGLAVALRLRDGPDIVARFAYLLLLALAVGSLRAINTWDFPTYMALGAAAVAIGEYARSRHISIAMVVRVVLQVALLFWLTTLLFRPYVEGYQSFTNGVFASEWQTPLYGYLGIHGLFILVALSFLSYQVRSYLPPFFRAIIGHKSDEGIKTELATDSAKAIRLAVVVGLLIATIITLVASGYTTVAFLSVLAALTSLLAWRWMQSGEESPYGVFALALLGMALALGIGVEIVTIKGDIARMNTVFKFYIQAWVLLGMATAYLLWRMEFGKAILRGVPGNLAGRALGGAWMVLLLALLLGSSIYTVAGTQARLRDRFQALPLTLDGLAFMGSAQYTFDRGRGSEELRRDYDAILWLRGEEIVGSPVVLEGQGEIYRTLHGRVSMYTGLPTVLGWDNHQSQQRGYGPVIGERISDIRRMYSTASWQEASELLRKYQVQYIYVGELERHFYPKQGLDKFDSMVGTELELAYANPGVRIYRVVADMLRVE
ncbi:MAG: glycosyltransferase family 39 protein [Chloroflexi bacterium]|nr:glycosyltransferase family 39 protein [Chloroflexota bacterium]